MEQNGIFSLGLLHPSFPHAGEKSPKRETRFPIATEIMYRLTALVITVLLSLWASVSTAATFTPLGFQTGGTSSIAWDVSGDGSTVVGYGGSSLGNQAFYWTSATGMVGSGVGSSFAYGVNQDGSVIVGSGSASSSNAMRWTVATGVVEDLGNFSGVGGFSVARGVSADGLTVAGQNTKQSITGARFDAMRWHGPAGNVVATSLGFLPGVTSNSLFAGANDISTDGLVIVGYSRSAAGQEGFRWFDDGDPNTPNMSSMGLATSFASAVSSDGRFAVGGGVAGEAFLWDNANPGSIVPLGDLPGDPFSSRGNDVSADGSIVVGQSRTDTNVDEAFIWDAANGMRRLQDVLAAEGIDLTDWTLTTANGISDDGSTIVGWGINPMGQNEAWVATLDLDSEAPVVSGLFVDASPSPLGAAITLTAAVDDTTTGNSNIAAAEYSIDQGPWNAMSTLDGSSDSPVEAVTVSIPAFAAAGIYEVCVRGADERDNTSDPGTDPENACTLLVAYDPDGGFVTGGGWIDSAVGACLLDAACALAEGKANFGFVSKYKKNAQVPTGNTEFKFSAGGLDFHSDNYEWLVVNMNGSNAQYKGSGTVNGNLSPSGDAYKFMLWARDLDAGDTLRIKVWYDDAFGGEVVVYDNGFAQAIGGGNIAIHTK